jgi:hypothetical protein
MTLPNMDELSASEWLRCRGLLGTDTDTDLVSDLMELMDRYYAKGYRAAGREAGTTHDYHTTDAGTVAPTPHMGDE